MADAIQFGCLVSLFHGITVMRLIEQQREIRHRIEKVCPHIDQVKFSFDSNRVLFAKEEWTQLKKLCKDARIYSIKEREGRANLWKQRLVLLQPLRECLILLKKILSNKLYTCIVGYVEVTIDWITETRQDARYIQNVFNLSLVRRSGQQQYHYFRCGKKKSKSKSLDKTTYFTPKGSSIGVAMYSDHDSKIVDGQPCAHLEIRFGNAAVCSTKKLSTLNELIELDILELFRSTIHLFPRPTKSALGAYLANLQNSKAKTPQGYIKICNQFIEELCRSISKEERPKTYKDIPLQLLVNEEPELYRLLKSKKNNKEVNRYRDYICHILFKS